MKQPGDTARFAAFYVFTAVYLSLTVVVAAGCMVGLVLAAVALGF